MTEPISFPVDRRQGVEPSGLGYVYRNPSLRLTLRFTYLRQGTEPSAEIRAETDLPGVTGHLVTSRIKLTGSRSKSDYAKALWDAWDVQPQKVWADQVELACQDVLERMRAGTPIISIEGDLEIPPERPALVEPLLQEHATTILYGAGGSGKGWIAIGLCVAIGQGMPFCGMPTQGGRVLYLDFEDDANEFKRRAKAVAMGMGVSLRGLKYRECRQSLESMIEPLSSYVHDEGIRLVVVDSMEAAMGQAGEHDTAAARANRLMDLLRHLETTALVLDHVTGDGMKSKELAGRPFDSVFKQFRARATWEVKKDQQTGATHWDVGLYLTKTNRTAPLAPIGLHIDLGTPGVVRFEKTDVRESAVLAHATSWAYRIDGELRKGPLSYAALYEALGATESSDQAAVRQAVSRGVKAKKLATYDAGGVMQVGLVEQSCNVV